jgi:hypothetical protein
MQFRLTYDGRLPSHGKNNRGRHIPELKHEIRHQIHPQLAELWGRKPLPLVRARYGERMQRTCGSFTFLPLISDHLKLLCHLHILFLRNEKPGSLFSKPQNEYGGDLDNRLKLFLDALSVPREQGELKDILPQEGELPFYCLLDDDSLVTDLRVETDTLLGNEKTDKVDKVRLIVQVTIKAAIVVDSNLALIS